MTEESLFKTCEFLHVTHRQPIACYRKDKTLLQIFCSYPNYEKVFSSILKKSISEEKSLVSGLVGLYGIIKISSLNMVLITGPFVNKKIDETVLDSLIHEYSLLSEEKEDLQKFLLSLPHHSLNRFLSFIALLEYLFNKKETEITSYYKDLSPELQKKVETKYAQNLSEEEFSHNTYNLEQQLLSYVSSGDTLGLSSFLDTISKGQTFSEGKVADDTLRQAKNIFIGFVSMIGKAGAIKGGLDIETAYHMIDLYTQECERCTSVYDVTQLEYTALMDFTKRVSDLKHPQAYSPEVYKALQYIKTHTHSLFGVPDVISHVNKSRSSFLPQFKKETGYTIGQYITKAKLDESKLLLAYSDKSLAYISSFLCFSSQSYFQNLFKKEYGITPMNYKKESHKDIE